jgi:hypothetical protein
MTNPPLIQVSPVATGTTTASVSWSSATTGGSCLVIWVLAAHNTSAPTITAATNYTQAVTVTNLTLRLSGYTFQNSTSQSSSGNFTIGGVTPRMAAIGLEYGPGVAVSNAVDQSSSNSGTTGTLDSGTTPTTSQANEIVCAGFGELTGTTFTIATQTPQFAMEAQGSNGALLTLGVADYLATAKAAFDAQCTAGTVTTWAGAIFTLLYTPSSSGGPPLFRSNPMNGMGIGGQFFSNPLSRWEGRKTYSFPTRRRRRTRNLLDEIGRA